MFSKKDKPEVKSGVIGPRNDVVNDVSDQKKKEKRRISDDLFDELVKWAFIFFLILMFFLFSYLYLQS